MEKLLLELDDDLIEELMKMAEREGIQLEEMVLRVIEKSCKD